MKYSINIAEGSNVACKTKQPPLKRPQYLGRDQVEQLAQWPAWYEVNHFTFWNIFHNWYWMWQNIDRYSSEYETCSVSQISPCFPHASYVERGKIFNTWYEVDHFKTFTLRRWLIVQIIWNMFSCTDFPLFSSYKLCRKGKGFQYIWR